MPLEERPIAIRCAVLCFFAVCIVGVFQGLPPETCSQRGAIGALAVYIGMRFAVKAINAILMQAMIASWTDQQKESVSDEQS